MPDETPHPSDGSVRITTRDIYDQLVLLRDDVRTVMQLSVDFKHDLDDHEQRIRHLERWKHAIPASLISAVLAAGVSIVVAIAR